ncbi:hypothetical protein CAPTEDRAFT_197153 [Capitella teleta]|uniref:Uncharacterized protein n=1 Tax=Capitella teleta TaxID=283909 RepID=R7U041_CAPTE|nr:hypothetical protein CAPTEDRAFT_197153 [Capitella teleta]|eukprot:ELT99334.1 hypothetical protein CAPTEDRAFT_197153 [Capitella teleta]
MAGCSRLRLFLQSLVHLAGITSGDHVADILGDSWPEHAGSCALLASGDTQMSFMYIAQIVTDERKRTDCVNQDAQTNLLSDCQAELVTEKFQNIVEPLIEKVQALKVQFAKLESSLQLIKPQDEAPTTSPPSFAKIVKTVKTSVQSLLIEEKIHNNVVISGLAECENDRDEVSQICDTLEFKAKPIDVQWLGSKGERPRLLKMTFFSKFDARAFLSKVSEAKKVDSSTLPKLRCQLGQTKYEQKKHRKLSQMTFNLNNEAKKAGTNASFSVRDSGEIWKFASNYEEIWTRDHQWSAPEDQSLGNAC